MLKASHTYTNRQLIFRKPSYETNKHPVFFFFFFGLLNTCTYTLKQFSLHIHEIYSLSFPKAQDFEGFDSNLKYGFRLWICDPTNYVNSSALSYLFWVQLALTYLIIALKKHDFLLWYHAWKKGKKKISHTSNCMHTHTVGYCRFATVA